MGQLGFHADAANIFEARRLSNATVTSRLFSKLLIAEWLGAVVLAALLSPRTWEGSRSVVHPHVWGAILFGFGLAAIPLCLTLQAPAHAITKHTIAACQMLMSLLLIDVTGGRIETHFHVFGSLAFLAFYQEWELLVTASLVTVIYHVCAMIWWPEVLYGLATVSLWRPLEHAWWVIFEDFFLVLSMRRSLKDSRALAQREAWLSHGAHHDVLTGLANRRALDQYFTSLSADDAASSVGLPSALFFIDLDRFKQLNDSLGHRAGDEVLVGISQRIAAILRPSDLLSRIGGDEFLVILRDMPDVAFATTVAERILDQIGLPFEIGGSDVILSASVGVSLYPQHGKDLLRLQEAADDAMYEAKSRGRNQFYVYSTEGKSGRTRCLKHDLQNAIGTDQFHLHFQPQVDAEGVIVGFEALARWRHEIHGAVSPAEFIPVAESSGLIIPLGKWVLSRATRRCAEWNRHLRRPVRVAVNVSAIQIQAPDFAAMVEEVIKNEGIEPSWLEIEITESVLISDRDVVCGHLSRLRALGVSVAIDDFGTGYSSLGILQKLPIDRLKLDRCFLQRKSSDQPVILRSLIDMAHALGIAVVAEGVETNAQKNLLRDLHCDEMQGFLFSPPVPYQRALDLVESRAGDLVA